MSKRVAVGAEVSGSRRTVLDAAAALFAEHGYTHVTIRDIAARARVSPAMVMKCGGSKKQLFYETATLTPQALPEVPLQSLGEALVRDLLDRAANRSIDLLYRALILRLSAPDPEAVRQQLIAAYLTPLTERLSGDETSILRAELIVAALMGLTSNVRLFEAAAIPNEAEDVVRLFGAAVQTIIDG